MGSLISIASLDQEAGYVRLYCLNTAELWLPIKIKLYPMAYSHNEIKVQYALNYTPYPPDPPPQSTPAPRPSS